MTAGPLLIEVLVERRYLAQDQPAGTIEALRALGHDVRLVVPDEDVVALCGRRRLLEADLVLGRGRSDALLCCLSLAEHAGVPTVNTAEAVRRALHKEVVCVLLAAASVPVPRSWLMPASSLVELPEAAFPLVVKPPTGDNGRGVRVVRGPDEVRRLPAQDRLVLAQSLVPFDGEDLKLYVIGDQVFASRKPSPLLRDGQLVGTGRARATARARRWPLTAELRDLALTCAALTGLELLGVDLVLGPDGPVVIEVNDYPNYSAVPDAGARIAAHLLASTRKALTCASAS